MELFVIINNDGMKINVDVNAKNYFMCRKKLVDKLIEECTGNIKKTNLVKKTLDKNENKDKCNSHVVYKVLFWTFFILFIINIGIDIYFVYGKYVDHNKY